MKTAALRPGTPPTRRTPLQAKTRDPVTRTTRQRMWRRCGGYCEIRMTEACIRRRGWVREDGWQYSHRVRRRDTPTHGPAGGCVSCPECHSWLGVSAPRRQAEECGWLIRAESVQARNPAKVKVLIGGRWWLLDDKGGRTEVA